MDATQFLTGLLSIIVIDLVLAGDNAIVIGLAARNLPKDKQKKAIFWGTSGAIILRALLTVIVVWLLKIPFLMLAGGLFLIWIAFKLLIQPKKKEAGVKEGQSLFEALRTIIVADVVMGLDNVLAIAGAAQGHYLLVFLGLIISVPIIVWGSTLILRAIDRFPAIIYIGAGVLAFTAGKMITDEKYIHPYLGEPLILKYGFIVILTVTVLMIGYFKNKNRKPAF